MTIQKLSTSAERLLDGAQEYCESLEVLAGHPNKSSADAIGLLASHSLEVALKAFLLMRGWTEEQLRKEVSHDLETAWIKAADNGLPISHERPFWVRVLALGHGSLISIVIRRKLLQ